MKLAFAALLLIVPLAAAPRIYLLHDEPGPMEQLAAYLEENGHATAVEDQAEFRKHLSTTSAEAIFMYVHGDLAPDITGYLIRYAETGGRLIILHHGMASGKIRNPRWLGFLGVSILPKDAKENAWAVLRGDYELVNLNPAHYVTTHKVEYAKTVTTFHLTRLLRHKSFRPSCCRTLNCS